MNTAQRTGSVQYGFDLASDGVTLVPNENEQAVIAAIHSKRIEGRTLKQIAEELTLGAMPTRQDSCKGDMELGRIRKVHVIVAVEIKDFASWLRTLTGTRKTEANLHDVVVVLIHVAIPIKVAPQLAGLRKPR